MQFLTILVRALTEDVPAVDLSVVLYKSWSPYFSKLKGFLYNTFMIATPVTFVRGGRAVPTYVRARANLIFPVMIDRQSGIFH